MINTYIRLGECGVKFSGRKGVVAVVGCGVKCLSAGELTPVEVCGRRRDKS